MDVNTLLICLAMGFGPLAVASETCAEHDDSCDAHQSMTQASVGVTNRMPKDLDSFIQERVKTSRMTKQKGTNTMEKAGTQEKEGQVGDSTVGPLPEKCNAFASACEPGAVHDYATSWPPHLSSWGDMKQGLVLCCMGNGHLEDVCEGIGVEVFKNHVASGRAFPEGIDDLFCNTLDDLRQAHFDWEQANQNVGLTQQEIRGSIVKRISTKRTEAAALFEHMLNKGAVATDTALAQIGQQKTAVLSLLTKSVGTYLSSCLVAATPAPTPPPVPQECCECIRKVREAQASTPMQRAWCWNYTENCLTLSEEYGFESCRQCKSLEPYSARAQHCPYDIRCPQPYQPCDEVDQANCQARANNGECDLNATTQTDCPLSCGLCDGGTATAASLTRTAAPQAPVDAGLVEESLVRKSGDC